MSQNLLIPFRRNQRSDFAYGNGEKLVASKIRQILGTEGISPNSSGELPWRTDFGSPIHTLLHHNNDQVTAEMARGYIKEALRKWLPEVEVTKVEATREDGCLYLTIRYTYKETANSSEVSVPLEEK